MDFKSLSLAPAVKKNKDLSGKIKVGNKVISGKIKL